MFQGIYYERKIKCNFSQEVISQGNVFRHPATGVTTSGAIIPTNYINSEGWTTISDFQSTPEVSAPYETSEWLPVLAGNMTNFTQERSYKVTESYYTQHQQELSSTGERRLFGDKEYVTEEKLLSESRNVTVAERVESIGEPYDCSGHAPLECEVEGGLEFTQTSTCTQDEATIYTYVSDSASLGEWTGETTPVEIEVTETLTGSGEAAPLVPPIIFDMGTVPIFDSTSIGRFNLDLSSVPVDIMEYNKIVMIVDYEHTYPMDMFYQIRSPNEYNVFTYIEESNDLGERYREMPIDFFPVNPIGEWEVHVHDMYEGDGGNIKVRFEIYHQNNGGYEYEEPPVGDDHLYF